MMSEKVRIAFEQQVLLLALNDILPSKVLAPRLKETTKYKRIVASVAQLGLIEPLSVARQKGGRYLLLDGHVRFDALRAQGASQARCVVAEDDEAFTYNKRINRLSAIQEHYMIVRALERGVPEEKLARALSVDVKVIRQRRHLLCGISSEVAEFLKDRPVGHHAFQKLRKMRPIRQLEVAALMVSANNYTFSYVKALLATSKAADLLAAVGEDYKELEMSYGDDMLVLVVAAGFLEQLLSKPDIERFLAGRHPEFLENFRAIVLAASLDQTAAAA